MCMKFNKYLKKIHHINYSYYSTQHLIKVLLAFYLYLSLAQSV
jgi:hypothetical protein